MCKQCSTNPVYEFTNKRNLCKNCFVKYFQKKVFYTIRKFKMLHSGESVYCKKDKDFRSVVLKDVLEIYCAKANVKLTKSGKIAVPSSLDLEAKQIVKSIIENKIDDISPTKNKIIKPLYLFLDEEILLYAKIRKLKFAKEKKKEDFVDELEKKHPEIKRAIVNSYLKIYNKS